MPTAATPTGPKHQHQHSQAWLLPPGMEHTSCLCSHRLWGSLPTQLLLKWESPECTKPPRKPQKIQPLPPHLPASFQPLLCSTAPAQELPQCDRTAMVATGEHIPMKCDRGQLQGRDPAFPGFTLFPAKLVPAVLCPLPSNLHHTNSLEETFDVCKRLFTFSNQPAQFLGGWKALVLLTFFFFF